MSPRITIEKNNNPMALAVSALHREHSHFLYRFRSILDEIRSVWRRWTHFLLRLTSHPKSAIRPVWLLFHPLIILHTPILINSPSPFFYKFEPRGHRCLPVYYHWRNSSRKIRIFRHRHGNASGCRIKRSILLNACREITFFRTRRITSRMTNSLIKHSWIIIHNYIWIVII